MENEKYIILKLSDAKLISKLIKEDLINGN